MIRNLLLSSAIVAVTGATALALPPDETISPDKPATASIRFAPGEAPPAVANHIHDPGRVFYSSFAYKYPLGLYIGYYGYNVSGPSSGAGSQWLGIPVGSASGINSSGFSFAIGNIGGVNSVRLGIWTDSGNVSPGAPITCVPTAVKCTNPTYDFDVPNGLLPAFGSCCLITTINFDIKATRMPLLHLNAGQKYWLIAYTDANSMNSLDGANFESVNMTPTFYLAYSLDQGTTWTVLQNQTMEIATALYYQ